MTKPEHIALFGGTFNPIHNGHLRAAASAADKENIHRVIFIPSYQPPHRRVEGGVSAGDRLEMVRLACDVDSRFEASDVEIDRGKKSFSIDTVNHFLQTEPAGTEISFLIGADAFAEIDTWRRAKELLALCDFLVMARPGAQTDLVGCLPVDLQPFFLTIEKKRLVHKSGKTTRLVEIDGIRLSSTEIRDRAKQGKSLEGLVPDPVLHFIAKRRLYG